MKGNTPIDEVRIHELADLFPDLEGEALDELNSDIAENGVLVPLIFQEAADGALVLLDGRHRLRAWTALKDADAGVSDYPMEIIEDTADAFTRVISANIKRRHLDESQRAMMAAKVSAWSQRGGDRRSDQSRVADNERYLRPLALRCRWRLVRQCLRAASRHGSHGVASGSSAGRLRCCR